MASYDDTATVSGSVVSIENGADEVGAKSCVVTVRPTLSGVSSVSEKHTGKNLFDKSAVTANTWIIVNSTETEPTNSYSTSDYIPVKANTRYYVSFKDSNRSAYYDKNMNGIAYFPFNGNASFTALYDGYIRITIKNDIDLDTFIVNEGNTVVPYEPFGTTYTANLGRTIYGGTADIVNSTGKDTTLRYELDENDSWSAYSGASHSFWHNVATGEDRPIKQTEASESICNYATYSSASPSSAPDFSFLIQGGQRIVVTADSTIDTVDKFKTWLSSHNLVFVCPSSTPTDFTFTGQEVPTRLGYNAFWSEQGNTELTYYKSGYGFTSVTVNNTGKNIYNKEDGVYDDTYFNQDGTTTHYADVAVSWIRVKPNTKYTFSLGATPSHSTFLRWINCDKDKNFISRPVASYGSQNFPYTVTTPNYCQWVQLAINEYPTAQISSNDWIIQIEEGNSATTYEAYSGVTKTAKLHKVIYGGKANVIRGTCEPKNLAELSTITYDQSQKCTWEYTNGGVVITATGTYARVGFVIPVKTGKTYTISYRGFSDAGYRRVYLNSTSAWSGQFYNNILTETDTAYTYTFTATTNTLFIGLYVTAGTTTGTMTFSELMLEEGSTASEYVPHFEPFTFPPISISTDEGENTLFANEGASAITYRKAVD